MPISSSARRARTPLATLALALTAFFTLASDTPDPASVTVAGSAQAELGCSGDWQPECEVTRLGFDAEDGVWQGVFDFPPGAGSTRRR